MFGLENYNRKSSKKYQNTNIKVVFKNVAVIETSQIFTKTFISIQTFLSLHMSYIHGVLNSI